MAIQQHKPSTYIRYIPGWAEYKDEGSQRNMQGCSPRGRCLASRQIFDCLVHAFASPGLCLVLPRSRRLCLGLGLASSFVPRPPLGLGNICLGLLCRVFAGRRSYMGRSYHGTPAPAVVQQVTSGLSSFSRRYFHYHNDQLQRCWFILIIYLVAPLICNHTLKQKCAVTMISSYQRLCTASVIQTLFVQAYKLVYWKVDR